MKQRKTIYHLIVDKSGSMSDCIENTVVGFNEQVKRIKQLELEFLNEEITIGLTTFNHSVYLHYFGTVPSSIPKLTPETYCPSGSTALLDAIGITIKQIEGSLEMIPKNLPTTVVVVILTDGYENASQSFALAKIRSTISRLEETGNWTFSFIGATLDAVDIAVQMSIKSENSFVFEKKGMKSEVWDLLDESLTKYYTNKNLGIKNDSFFDKKKQK